MRSVTQYERTAYSPAEANSTANRPNAPSIATIGRRGVSDSEGRSVDGFTSGRTVRDKASVMG